MATLAECEFVLLALATIGYVVAMALYWWFLLAGRGVSNQWASRLAVAALLVQALWFAVRTYRAGHLPIYDGHGFSATFAGGAALAVLIFERLAHRRDLGAFALPIALGLLGYAWTLPRAAGPLILIFKSFWLTAHILTAIVAYSCFAIAFAASCLYLIMTRSIVSGSPPSGISSSSAVVDRLAYQVTVLGFPFMSLCVISGAIWAENVWGRYWSWDPKETWSLITWLVFAAYLHTRYHRGWSPRRAAVLAIVGFLTVLMNFIGVEIIYQYQTAKFPGLM